MTSRSPIHIYTDGACSGNPGPGGWAAILIDDGVEVELSGGESSTTNNRMELMGPIQSLRSLPERRIVELYSDSAYVVNCFRDKWYEGWRKNGWRNSQKKPVANRDLWEPLIAAYRADVGRLRFRWVKGHSNDALNDIVDRLAVEAARTQAGRSGT